ncbi:MAG: relaxase/mobilization nuclease domain-containing protein, partial [Nostoc sp.]
LNPDKSDAKQQATSEIINTISDFIEQSLVESTLIETLPQLAEQLSEYQQNLSAGRTTYDELLAAIAEREQLLSQRTVDAIADFIEQSVVDDALSETLPQLTEQLSQYHQQLSAGRTAFDELLAAIALSEQLRSQRIVDSIADFIEQSVVDDTLSETLPQLAKQLSGYHQQVANNKTTLDELSSAIADVEQRLLSQRAVDAISDYIEQSAVESALTQTVLELTQQLSQYKEELVTAKATFNDLDAVLAAELQSYLEKRAILSISDYIEQSTVESALTQTVLELTQQLSQSQEQLSAGRTIFDDLEAAIVYLDQLHRSQKAVDAIALNQTPTITTDEPKLKDNLSADLYEYYSADLQNLLVTDRDKEIAIRALLDDKPPQDVEEILQASPAGWTQDEARELVLIASNQLATQKSEPEQSLDEKQRIESELLAMAVPIAVELINWQLRE